MGAFIVHAKRELDRFEEVVTQRSDVPIEAMAIWAASGIVRKLAVVVNEEVPDNLEVLDQALHLLMRLYMRKPLTPLTGEDDEWAPTKDQLLERNKRCSTVIRVTGEDGAKTAYDLGAKLFSDNDGETWSIGAYGDMDPITFPYAPPDVPERVMEEILGA